MKRLISCLMAVMVMVSCLSAAGLAEESVPTISSVVTALSEKTGLDELYARFDDAAKEQIPRWMLDTLWDDICGQMGSFVGFADDETAQEYPDYTIYTQTLNMASQNLICVLVIDQDGMIGGLGFTPKEDTTAEPQATSVPSELDEAVTVTADEAYPLSGTLTMPVSDQPVPAVVLVHGSGPNDRDETVGQTKLFHDLADSLSAQGIAVLRYDKRTHTYGRELTASAEALAAFTVEEETIQDAIAAGKLLRADTRVDPDRVYVLGHSMGAMLAPRIVRESEGIFAGMILANGTNVSMLDVMIRQISDVAEALTDDTQRSIYEQQLTDAQTQRDALPTMTAEEAKAITIFGQPGYYFWEMAQQDTPADIMTALACPTLIINGTRDFQVNGTEGRVGWEALLDMNAPWLTCLWADVNHLLMQPDADEEAAGTSAEYDIPCIVDQDTANAIAAFILKTEDTIQ